MAVYDTLQSFVPANNQPPAANPATLVLRNGTWYLAFDPNTQEIAIFSGYMPHNYQGGSLKVNIHWIAVPVAGTVGWDVAFERRNRANHDLDADAFAADQLVVAEVVPATSGVVETTSITIAAGAATDFLDADEPFRLRVKRDVATDTAAGDAQLLAIDITEA